MWMWPLLDLLASKGSSCWFFDSIMFTNEIWEEEFGEVAPIGAGDRSAFSVEIS